MHQPLYVLVYPSRLFAAHWSFWIPYLDASGQESDTGDRVHVTGDRLNGFEYEYVRDYNVREDERRPKSFAIGLLSTAPASEGAEYDHSAVDVAAGENDAFNPFDRACREVQAPGPSLNKVSMTTDGGKASGPPLRKTQVKDCQWWIKQAVAHLVEADMLLPLDSEGHGARTTPVERVEELPRH